MVTNVDAADQHAFVLAGLPGCGKSTAAHIIETELENNYEAATATEVSDYVRTKFEAAHDDGDVNDNGLGRWAAEQKQENGDGFFVRQMVQHWLSDEAPHVIISGVRSPEEAEAVRDGFGDENTTVIAVWTLPDIRFERKYGDVPSEDHSEWETFQERNEREIHEWDCLDFFVDADLYDYIVTNNQTVTALEIELNAIVNIEVFGFDMPDEWNDDYYPFPKRDPEVVAQYL